MYLLNNYSAFFSFLQSSPLSNRKLLIVKGLFQERTQKAQTRRERERECGGGEVARRFRSRYYDRCPSYETHSSLGYLGWNAQQDCYSSAVGLVTE